MMIVMRKLFESLAGLAFFIYLLYEGVFRSIFIVLPIWVLNILMLPISPLISRLTQSIFGRVVEFSVIPILGCYVNFCYTSKSFSAVFTNQSILSRWTDIRIVDRISFIDFKNIILSRWARFDLAYPYKKNILITKLYFNGDFLKEKDNYDISKNEEDILDVVNILIKKDMTDKDYNLSISVKASATYRGWESVNYFISLQKYNDEVFKDVIVVGKENIFIVNFKIKKEQLYTSLSEILNQSFEHLGKSMKSVETYLKSASELRFILPNSIKYPILQYMIFFDEYIKYVKQENIETTSVKVEDGIKISFKSDTNYDSDHLKKWLVEYIEILQTGGMNFHDTKNKDFNIFYTQLLRQINHTIESIITYMPLNNQFQQNEIIFDNSKLFQNTIQSIALLEINKGKRITKDELSIFVDNDQLPTLIDILRNNLTNEEMIKNFRLIVGRHSAMISDGFRGTVSSGELDTKRNQIRHSFLEFISLIPPDTYFYIKNKAQN